MFIPIRARQAKPTGARSALRGPDEIARGCHRRAPLVPLHVLRSLGVAALVAAFVPATRATAAVAVGQADSLGRAPECCPLSVISAASAAPAGPAGALRSLFDTSDFPPRWHCGVWTAQHGWLHIVSDMGIWLAYVLIPALLVIFILRRRDVPFPPIFWLFGAFILLCGMTHLLEAAMFWWPAYRFMGVVKLVTAIVSLATVAVLVPILPRALALPGVARLNDELKREIEQRREAEARFRLAVESSPSAMIMTDASGTILLVNRQTESLFGYSRDELVGQKVEMLVPQRYRAGHPAHRAGFFADPSVRHLGEGRELFGQRKDGSEFPIEIGLNPIQTDAGPLVLAAVVDITERKAAHARMLQKQKDESISLLAAGIAHDFNNLLVATLGNAGALLDTPLSEEQRKMSRSIVNASERMAELSRQLVAYARGGRYQPRPVDLNRTVTEVLDLIRSSIPPRVSVMVSCDPRLHVVEADASQMTQVIVNLCVNACEAMGESGSLGIRTSNLALTESHGCETGEIVEPGEYVCLDVSDSGPGIDDSVRSRIFEPFFSTKGLGRGLGLAAVAGIVRNHGGAIELHNHARCGCTFRILLPRSARPATPLETIRKLPPRRDISARVLVVDDEEPVRQIIDGILRTAGHHVTLAADGAAALRAASDPRCEIQVVLLDLRMPGMGGAQVFERLSVLRPEARIIICSGFEASDVPAELSGHKQFAGFLAKPFHSEDLLIAVSAALSRAVVEV